MSARRKPRAFAPDARGVTVDAPPPPDDTTAVVGVMPEADPETPPPASPGEEAPVAVRRGWRWGRLFLVAIGALVSLAAGLAVTELIEGLYARNPWLGHAGLALIGLCAAAGLAIAMREVIAISRLRTLERIRISAERAHRHNDADDARAVIAELKTLYDKRPDMRWPLGRLAEHDAEIMDGTDRLTLAEKTLMAGLDSAARAIIARTARRTSVITAVNPAPVLDMIVVAAQNLSMIRQLATLYGSRPATVGTIRLARMVITHLAVSGGLAVSDNLIQHLLGRGLAGRLSAKIGEGAVNGIMTARIGIAALDLCRPLVFHARQRPSLQSVIGGALSRDAPAETDEKPKQD